MRKTTCHVHACLYTERSGRLLAIESGQVELRDHVVCVVHTLVFVLMSASI